MDMNDYFKENKEFKDVYKRMMKQMTEKSDNNYHDFKQECLIIVLTNGDSFDYPLEILNDRHKEDIVEKIASCIDENIVIEIHNKEGHFYLNARNIAYFYFKN